MLLLNIHSTHKTLSTTELVLPQAAEIAVDALSVLLITMTEIIMLSLEDDSMTLAERQNGSPIF